jgi:carbon monoxide dehydrogenase subunit G
MKLEQSFEVAAPIEQVWDALIDIERVAPCLPGASVTGRNEDGSYSGAMTIKIGPTTAAYAGRLEMEQIDEDARAATMQAQGTDKRGQGGAKATISSKLSSLDGDRTRVEVITDYHITGRLARFGRGGMIEDISERLLRDFAQCLQSTLVGGRDAQAAETQDGAEPASTDGASAAAEPAAAPTAETPTPAEPQESQPLNAVPLVAGVVRDRAKAHQLPIGAIIFGFVLALLIMRRRARR